MNEPTYHFHNFNFEKIKTNFILSLGSHCRVAHHLRKNHLRELACPLDWMINDKLEVVWDLFRSDFRDFFTSCSVLKSHKDSCEVKDNHNDMIAIHYFFPNQDLEMQAKRINKQARRRWELIKQKILASKKVVFVRSGDFDFEKSCKFLQNIAGLFSKNGGGFCLINVSHNENLKEDEMTVQKFNVGENLTLIHYSVFENEGFTGNIDFWTQMLKQSIITTRTKRLKNALNSVKLRFIRSCKRRKAFFTKKIKSDLDMTQL